jgi:enoyl-CoA hydratase/carnithine racemase
MSNSPSKGAALMALLGGEDFDGERAERYGYVNRAVPDAEFVGFVNAFAERVARPPLKSSPTTRRNTSQLSHPREARSDAPGSSPASHAAQ